MTNALDFYDADESFLKEFAQTVISKAAKLGASAAEVAVGIERGLSVTARLKQVETLEFNRDKGIGITVYFDQKKGSANTTDLDPKSVDAALEAACTIAKATESDPFAGLAPADRMATSFPDLNIYHPWSIDETQAIDLAIECETAGLANNDISNSEGASVDSHLSRHVYANSHGFCGGYTSTRHSISCSLIAKDSQGNMQRDYAYTSSCDPSLLLSAAAIGQETAQKTVARLGARSVPTQRVPVLMVPDVAKRLWGHFLAAISGGNLYRESSFLLNKLNQPIFPKWFRCHEDPFLERGMGSTAFDGEGVATCARDIVSQGILQGYILSSYSARKLNMQTTGNAGGAHNVMIEPNVDTQDNLLKQMGTGLLVTELMGQGVNIVTGDYSRGAAGFWVENGAIAFPVEGVTIAANLTDMYRDLVAVAGDLDKRSNIITGSVLLADMMVAGE